jgi:hypothetical protein
MPYPLIDATSSGITQAESWFVVPPNFNRAKGTEAVGGTGGNNWGRLVVDFETDDPAVTFEILNELGEVGAQVGVKLSDISV